MKLSNWLARDGVERPLIWPCVTLALLCALNLWVNPHFLSLRMLDGHLFGAPIDVLNRAAPLVLVATGMTLVIATRGILPARRLPPSSQRNRRPPAASSLKRCWRRWSSAC